MLLVRRAVARSEGLEDFSRVRCVKPAESLGVEQRQPGVDEENRYRVQQKPGSKQP